MTVRAVTFPIAAATSAAYLAFPGGMEADAGVFAASGRIEAVAIRADTAAALLVEFFDAHNNVGLGVGSTNRAPYEIDITIGGALMGSTPNRFEVYGSAIANFTLGDFNKKGELRIQANTPTVDIALPMWFRFGMIVRVTPSAATAAATSVSVSYEPLELGSHRRKEKLRNAWQALA